MTRRAELALRDELLDHPAPLIGDGDGPARPCDQQRLREARRVEVRDDGGDDERAEDEQHARDVDGEGDGADVALAKGVRARA